MGGGGFFSANALSSPYDHPHRGRPRISDSSLKLMCVVILLMVEARSDAGRGRVEGTEEQAKEERVSPVARKAEGEARAPFLPTRQKAAEREAERDCLSSAEGLR